jgi:hypothetical protein
MTPGMRCPTCHDRVPLLSGKRPLRALLPRCRHCGTLALTNWHRAALALLAILLAYLVIWSVLGGFFFTKGG